MAAMAAQSGMTPAQVQAHMAKEYPSMTALLTNLPQMQHDFGGPMALMSGSTDIFARVRAGVDHWEPLVSTMQANVDDYESVSNLPNFNLFAVFFMVPGPLLALLAGIGLFAGREPALVATPTH